MRAIDDSSSWDLVAGVEVDERTRAVARDFIAPGVALTGSLAGAPDADAAVIATPPDVRTEPVIEALGRGLGILVEKPLAMSVEEATSLVAAAEAKELPLLVGQNYRYMRAHRTVKKIVSKGALGDVSLVRANYYRTRHAMAPSLARLRHAILWGIAVHHLDAIRYVLNQRAVGVLASSYETGDRSSPASTTDVLVEFDRGSRLNYTATYASSGHEFFEGGQEYYERIVGDDGTLHMLHRWLVLCPRGGWPRPIRRGKRSQTEEAILLEQLRRAVAGEGEAEVTGRENLETIAMLEACVRSSEERRWIDPRELLGAHDR